MASLKEKAVALLASKTGVDLNAVAATTLYTVPTGKKSVLDHVKIRELSASAGSTVLTIGQSAAKTDFVGAQTLSNLSAAGKAGKLQPVPNATPPAIVEYAAGLNIVADVTTAAGAACTCTMDVYGTEDDA